MVSADAAQQGVVLEMNSSVIADTIPTKLRPCPYQNLHVA